MYWVNTMVYMKTELYRTNTKRQGLVPAYFAFFDNYYCCACICSTQSENLRDLQIALRNLRILRTEANLQIACAICRLRNNARARSEDAAGTAVL